MKIELKDINISGQVPKAFIAFLYIDDLKAGIARNAGNYSLTVYHPIDEHGKQLIAEAEIHCKMLRTDRSCTKSKGQQQEMTLHQYIDDLVGKAYKQKKVRKNRKKL